VQTIISLSFFKGTIKITSLDAFPLKFHPDAQMVQKSLVERGRKWLGLTGIQHKQYQGIAALRIGERVLKHNVTYNRLLFRASFLTFFVLFCFCCD
jgi:hypothetical protein